MRWETDRQTTEWLRRAFNDPRLKVKRKGRQYLVEGTPYGLVEIVSLSRRDRFLIAAQAPPNEMSSSDVPTEILSHLRHHGLKPWRYATGTTIAEVLISLRDPGDILPEDMSIPWSPFVSPLPSDVTLVGEDRRQVAFQATAIVRMTGPNRPIPLLIGPASVGKQTVAAEVAAKLGLRGLRLCLPSALTPRLLQTPCEQLTDTMHLVRSQLGDDDLLVLSGAELLRRLPAYFLPYVLGQLGLLPHVLLLSIDHASETMTKCAGVLVPGLTERQEIQKLLRVALPDHHARPCGATLDMMARAASIPGIGILPGRLLDLIELAGLLRERRGCDAHVELTPDDAMAAIDLAGRAWRDTVASVEREL